MPNIFLREIIEAGFCGQYAPSAKAPTMGLLHYALDKIIARQIPMGDFIQLCSQNNVQFEDQPFFVKCLEGIHAKPGYFNKTDIEVEERSVLSGDKDVKYIVFRDKDTDRFIEPVYHFYSPETYVPIYSIMCAYLMGIEGPIKVDCISMIGDASHCKEYGTNQGQCHDLLTAYQSGCLSPGRQCLSCMAACNLKDNFESMVYTWMKAKQEVDAAEKVLREHLIYKGPSKCGAHLVYMKESVRRTFTPKLINSWLGELMTAVPALWQDYVKPDTAEIMRAIASGKLDKKFAKDFKESRSFSIDTTFSL